MSLIRSLETGTVFIALLLLARPARAHTPGLSVADFDVQTDGRVDAQVTFASGEPFAGLGLDRDGDGLVTAGEVSMARDELSAFLLSGVEVDADGLACTAAFRDASLTEVDGLVLQASYACPSDAAEIEVTLYYLTVAGTAGPRLQGPHKGVARIVAGTEMTEGVLTGERRAIALRLPGRPHAAARNARRAMVLIAGAVVVAMVTWSSRRWRAVRAAWQNRRS